MSTAGKFVGQPCGMSRRASDIDIAILPGAPLEPGTLGRIRDALEESMIPYEVELAASP